MKLNKKQLEKLEREYIKLKKSDKIISITEVKNAINDIITAQEKLEELLSYQRNALEIDDCGCEDELCKIEEPSDLYNLFDNLEDLVMDWKLYKAFYMID